MRRILRLWWVALALVPFGFAGWIGLAYAGARAHRRWWIGAAAVYAVTIAVAFGIDGPDGSTEDDVSLALVLASWAAQLIHAAAAAPADLRATDRRDAELEEAEAHAAARAEARRLAESDPQRALELGVGRPDEPNTFDAGLVDLNNASADAIEALPGVSRELAERIVRVREEVHGFSSLEVSATSSACPPRSSTV